MVLAELRELAGTLGVNDTTGMRRGDLISEIKKRQGGGQRRGRGRQLPLGDEPEAPSAAGADRVSADRRRRRAARRRRGQARPPSRQPPQGRHPGPEAGAPGGERRPGARTATPETAESVAEAVTATTDAPVADAAEAAEASAPTGRPAPFAAQRPP